MDMNIDELGVRFDSSCGSLKHNRAPRARGLAPWIVAALAAVTLGVANQASAHQSPAGCTSNGPASSITIHFDLTAVDIKHGDEICIQVQLLDTCAGCCDVTLLDTELVMPDGSVIPITSDASVLFGDSFLCPDGDPRCLSLSTCTLPQGQEGFKYIIDHGDEHAPLGAGCPPTPAPGSGQVSAYLRSTDGTVHTAPLHGFANICQTGPIPVGHACCEPCTGTCLNVLEGDCPFPSVYSPLQSCDEVTCTPLDCSGFVDQCNDARCNPATGTCEVVPRPLSTPCEVESPANLCSVDHCDGLGNCVLLNLRTCTDPIPPCEGGSSCNPSTGLCVSNSDGPLSTPCEAESPANLCTNDHCDGLGNCVLLNLRTCTDPIPPCEGGSSCNPSTGLCVSNSDGPLSTPCEAESPANLCTNDHCDGLGNCVLLNLRTCQPSNPPCEGGSNCNPSTGLCVDKGDAPLSTPCEAESPANLCTDDHCDGLGNCVFLNLRTCPDPVPPCEGGANCNPSDGSCVDKDDAPLSLPCETDTDACTNEHCDGLGLCVLLNNKCGACCDHGQAGGVCEDGASPADCVGGQLEYFPGESCADIEARGACDESDGACCDQNPFGGCVVLPETLCICPKCVFYKGSSCGEIECVHNSIPTMSQWGLVVLTLLLLIGAKVYFGRRQIGFA